jgi:hypothetical protein
MLKILDTIKNFLVPHCVPTARRFMCLRIFYQHNVPKGTKGNVPSGHYVGKNGQHANFCPFGDIMLVEKKRFSIITESR